MDRMRPPDRRGDGDGRRSKWTGQDHWTDRDEGGKELAMDLSTPQVRGGVGGDVEMQ